MKNQYVGDINDYRKYGLLRVLSGAGELRTGICWMLTPNDSRTDGKFTRYLAEREKWRHLDPPLFDCLAECVLGNGGRGVHEIEGARILPRAHFYSEVLTDNRTERGRVEPAHLSTLPSNVEK